MNRHETVTNLLNKQDDIEKAEIYRVETGLYVAFDNPQSAITEGQFVAWYLEDELVGSGVIS